MTLTVVSLVAAPGLARADRRYYGETYNAATAPRGALDVELWSTLSRPPKGGGPSSWLHQLELETGITDRWDIALYNVVRQVNGTPEYQAVKVETRYRLSDPGEWFVDPVLYLEVKKEFLEDKPWGVEEKLILGKDLGALNVSLNASAEQELPSGGGTELEWAYALGSSYEVAPIVRLGGEAWGAFTRGAEAGARYQTTAYAGPAVSLAAWRGWLVLAAGFGLTGESDRLRLRGILAFQF